MNEKRGSLYLVTGAVIGIVIGLILSLWIIPLRYSNTEPYTLRDADKETYRIVIARAYLVEADSNRAMTRLNLLGDGNPAQELVSQAQNLLANQGNEDYARALALLAAMVNQPSTQITPLAAVFPTSATPADAQTTQIVTEILPTKTPAATSTPRPTSTPQATQGAPYEWDNQLNPVCDPLPEIPLLQITVYDAAGKPVPGVKIEISKENSGVETFYTGLYPEINSGYADYEMLPGEVYTIRVGDEGVLVDDLSIPSCKTEEGETAAGSLSLIFKQP